MSEINLQLKVQKLNNIPSLTVNFQLNVKPLETPFKFFLTEENRYKNYF